MLSALSKVFTDKYFPFSLAFSALTYAILDNVTTMTALSLGGTELNPFYGTATTILKLSVTGSLVALSLSRVAKIKVARLSLCIMSTVFLSTFLFATINNLFVMGELL